jgi:hypothetical protein
VQHRALFVVSIVVFALLSVGCSRRKPAPAAAVASAVAVALERAATTPVDFCPRFAERDTPWSSGGFVRSLQPEAIVEPAQRAAGAGTPTSWGVEGTPIEGKFAEGDIALVSVIAFPVGAAVVLLREAGRGYCVGRVWFHSFGGAGVRLKPVAHHVVEGSDALLLTYTLSEGWSMNGANTWICKLVTFHVTGHSLEQKHITPDEPCQAEPWPLVRFVPTEGRLQLRRGKSSWDIGVPAPR